MALYKCSLRWFEARSYKPTSRGLPHWDSRPGSSMCCSGKRGLRVMQWSNVGSNPANFNIRISQKTALRRQMPSLRRAVLKKLANIRQMKKETLGDVLSIFYSIGLPNGNQSENLAWLFLRHSSREHFGAFYHFFPGYVFCVSGNHPRVPKRVLNRAGPTTHTSNRDLRFDRLWVTFIMRQRYPSLTSLRLHF